MERTVPDFRSTIQKSSEILIADGAMGTVLQRLGLSEHEFRGDLFADHDRPVTGLYDLLSLTHPKAVTSVHEKYLAAGAQIICTNTFMATPLDLAVYNLDGKTADICRTAAWLARTAVNKYTETTPGRPRFVAGVIGPGSRRCDYDVEFDEMVASYEVTAEGLVKGRVDCILIESIYYLRNAEAALTAVTKTQAELQTELPVWISFTLINEESRLASGESIVDAALSLGRFQPFVFGLNCGANPRHLGQFLTAMFEVQAPIVAFHPSAGMPDRNLEYSIDAAQFAEILGEAVERGWVDIIGGCCGTTPAHIAALAEMSIGAQARRVRWQHQAN